MTVPNENTAKPGEMYYLEPLHKLNENIDLPQNMYTLPNINGAVNHATDDIDTSQMSPELKTLFNRHTNILLSLESLQNEMKDISSKLGHKFGDKVSLPQKNSSSEGVTKSSGSAKSVAPIKLPEGVLDYVISISPQNLSLSPLFLAGMMQASGMNVNIVTQLHSSLQEMPSTDLLNGFGGLKGRVQVPSSKIYFTFVFKKDRFCPSMMFSPTNQTKIIGDVNIARYLSRTFLPDLYETGESNTASIDQWLDNAQKISHGNRKEKESALKSLNSSLGKQRHVACKEVTIADFVTLAALVSQKSFFKTLPANVKKWFLDAPPAVFDLSKKFGVPESWFK